MQLTELHHPVTDIAKDWADEKKNEYWNWHQQQQIMELKFMDTQ